MEKKLREKLEKIQNQPTTGFAHNEQIIFTQVETIFAVDKLTSEIGALSKSIKSSNTQSEKLEKSNYTLQVIMLILTGITTVIAIGPIIKNILTFLSQLSYFPEITNSIAILTTLLSLLIGLITAISTKKLSERYEEVKLKE